MTDKWKSYIFQVYIVMIWYTWWNDYHKLTYPSHHLIQLLFVYVYIVKILKIYSLSKFQVYNTVLLTIVTVLYIRGLHNLLIL